MRIECDMLADAWVNDEMNDILAEMVVKCIEIILKAIPEFDARRYVKKGGEMTISCYILEGTWWSNKEVPQVLPFFQALANSGDRINLSHRTFRNAADIAYWVSKIPKGEGAFLYFACHGDSQKLVPADGRSPILNKGLLKALGNAKEGAIEFIHFGCCEILDPNNPEESLGKYLDASRAKWASGYSNEIDWLPSMFLDLALLAELAVPYHNDSKGMRPKLSRVSRFLKAYEQLVRGQGFSGAYRNAKGEIKLSPQ